MDSLGVHAYSEDWADVQADLSLCLVHGQSLVFVGFVILRLPRFVGGDLRKTKVDIKGNDQQLIQSNSTFLPRHHTGKVQKQDGIKAESHKISSF